MIMEDLGEGARKGGAETVIPHLSALPAPLQNFTNDPCLLDMVGRKLSAVGCHFTRIKRITLFVSRIDSCPHTLLYLKNDARGSPQVHMSPCR